MNRGQSTRSRKILQGTAYALALGLLVASIWYAVQDQRAEDWNALLDAEPGMLFALFAAVVISAVVIPGFQFWLVTRPFVSTQPLGVGLMQALLAASSLLNYTPIKAGLIGRVGYLKQYHGVGLRAAALTHLLIGAMLVAAVLTIFLATAWSSVFDAFWWALVAAGLAAFALLAAFGLRAVLPGNMPVDPRLQNSLYWATCYLFVCLLVQVAALFAAALRWWLVFRILGHPISAVDAWLAAILHTFSIMLGPANGLGLREWLIGIASQQGWLSDTLGADIGTGLTAALADRAVEAVVLITCGLIGLWFLRRLIRSESAMPAASFPEES
jgi:hypothetical protein